MTQVGNHCNFNFQREKEPLRLTKRLLRSIAMQLKYFSAIGVAVAVLAACSSGGNRHGHSSDKANGDSIQVALTQVWATDTLSLITPECVSYDTERNVFFVSNLNRKDNAQYESRGFVAIVNANGSVKNAKWLEGFTAPLGNALHDGHLYVNEPNTIVKIAIEKGEVVARIALSEAIRLNGIAIHEDGTIYAADSQGNKVFKVDQEGTVTVVFEGDELNTPNGVLIDNGKLVVASSGGQSLKAIDLETGHIETLVEGIGQVDGIVRLHDGHYLTSSWTGEVYFISNDLKKQKILDTKAEKINAADIAYIPQQNVLVVPTFYDNRLVAYRVNIN